MCKFEDSVSCSGLYRSGITLRSEIEAPLITREVLLETYFLLLIMAADAQARPFLQFQEYHAGELGIAAFLLPNAILLPNAKTDHWPCLPRIVPKKLLINSIPSQPAIRRRAFVEDGGLNPS